MDTIGQKIKAERKIRRWTQTELAHRAGISQVIISLIENGDEPRLATLRQIADALGCLVIDLLPESDKKRIKKKKIPKQTDFLSEE